jgi:hypothetical protein
MHLGYHWMLGAAMSFGLFGGYVDWTENCEAYGPIPWMTCTRGAT